MVQDEMVQESKNKGLLNLLDGNILLQPRFEHYRAGPL